MMQKQPQIIQSSLESEFVKSKKKINLNNVESMNNERTNVRYYVKKIKPQIIISGL